MLYIKVGNSRSKIYSGNYLYLENVLFQQHRIFIHPTRKDRTSKHTGPRRTLKERYSKIRTTSPILEVLRGAVEMITKLMMQAIEIYVL